MECSIRQVRLFLDDLVLPQLLGFLFDVNLGGGVTLRTGAAVRAWPHHRTFEFSILFLSSAYYVTRVSSGFIKCFHS